jgi:hypothetical protein
MIISSSPPRRICFLHKQYYRKDKGVFNNVSYWTRL